MTNPHQLHLGIAEQGKLLALQGDHQEALRHYREAMRLAVAGKAPEVFFRHYTQCVLESLELTDSFDEIIQFCRDADDHYRSLDQAAGTRLAVHRKDHAAILERLGLALLKQGDRQAATEALERAVALASPAPLPLAQEVLGWVARGMHIDASRLLQCQHKHQYFVVRRGQVDERRARPLPASGHSRSTTSLFSEIKHA